MDVGGDPLCQITRYRPNAASPCFNEIHQISERKSGVCNSNVYKSSDHFLKNNIIVLIFHDTPAHTNTHTKRFLSTEGHTLQRRLLALYATYAVGWKVAQMWYLHTYMLYMYYLQYLFLLNIVQVYICLQAFFFSAFIRLKVPKPSSPHIYLEICVLVAVTHPTCPFCFQRLPHDKSDTPISHRWNYNTFSFIEMLEPSREHVQAINW